MPGPTNGDSSVTPSRSGIPACAFSANSRYRASVPSSTARARHGVAKLPPTTTLGVPGSAPSTIGQLPFRTNCASSSPVSRWPATRRPFTIVGEMRMKWSRCPGTHDVSADLLQAADLLAVGYRARLPDDGHAPAGVPVDVHGVGLERDDSAASRGRELSLGTRPDDDVAVDEREVDELDRGQRLPGIDDPADGHRAHQPHALIRRQLFERQAIGIHDKQDARRRPARPRVQGP